MAAPWTTSCRSTRPRELVGEEAPAAWGCGIPDDNRGRLLKDEMVLFPHKEVQESNLTKAVFPPFREKS